MGLARLPFQLVCLSALEYGHPRDKYPYVIERLKDEINKAGSYPITKMAMR
jgi:hypothetical protein